MSDRRIGNRQGSEIADRFAKPSDCLRASVRGFMLRELLLTPRQLDVLELLADGNGTKGIAKALSLSCRTIEDTISALHQVLGTRDRGEIVARWLQVFSNAVDVLGLFLPPHEAGSHDLRKWPGRDMRGDIRRLDDDERNDRR